MEQKLLVQVSKILALADSSHDAEAVAAVRKARELLARQGFSFADLGLAAGQLKSRGSLFSLLASTHPNHARVAELQQRLNTLKQEAHDLSQQAAMWRGRVTELEQNLTQRKAESERWRQLAHDTVEKLWNFGCQLSSEETQTSATIRPSVRAF